MATYLSSVMRCELLSIYNISVASSSTYLYSKLLPTKSTARCMCACLRCRLTSSFYLKLFICLEGSLTSVPKWVRSRNHYSPGIYVGRYMMVMHMVPIDQLLSG